MTSTASTAALTYTGPREVLVNQAITLTGTYNPQQITTVAVVAEDRFPLTVQLNATARRWEVRLSAGFNRAGLRWMRLRGTNAQGQVISNQMIYITVSATPMTTTTTLAVRILQDTVFKAAPISSTLLDNQQKTTTKTGQVFPITRYAQDGTHLKVEVRDNLNPVGNFGYFFSSHIQLIEQSASGGDTFPTSVRLVTTQSTWIKAKIDDASLLIPEEKQQLPAGTNLEITGYTSVAQHFRVTLAQPLPGFGRVGFIFNGHAKIFQNNNVEIPFDPNAITITVIKTTLLKKRPIDSTQLPNSEKQVVLAGMIYGVAKYAWRDSHIQVWLTENFPGFGNTGFFFPDFITLKRGDATIDTNAVVYRGPNEVLVDKPLTLSGQYDPIRVSTVAVIAEDKFPLQVALNSSSKTWQVNLNQGFSEPGARWLRLRGTDATGKVVDSQTVNITVSSDPLTVGQELRLKILRDTFFKLSSADSQTLGNSQKVLVKAGQTFTVNRYGYVDGHLKVELTNSITPVGTFGYLFEPHVELSKGSEVLYFDTGGVPGTEVSAKVLITRTTLIKTQPLDTSELPAGKTKELLLGQTFNITGYASVEGHFWLRFAEPIPGFGNTGYIFWQHIRVIRDEEIIPFDPNGLAMTALQTTALTKRAVNSDNLPEEEVVMLPHGETYGVDSYGLEGSWIRVALTQEFPNFGNTGYVLTDSVQFKRGGNPVDVYPIQAELNVPYFSQRDNPRFYWSTCNVTSIAMVFYYYGLRSRNVGQLEDELLQWCFDRYGVGSQTDHSVLSQLIRAYGFKTSFSTTRRFEEIDRELASRRPVVLAGDFTATGHILTVIGYTPSGYIVNDPWGNALTGYKNTEGRKLFYPNSYINRVCGPDGRVWAHFISK